MRDIVPIDNMEVCDPLGLSVVDLFYCSSYVQSLIQDSCSSVDMLLESVKINARHSPSLVSRYSCRRLLGRLLSAYGWLCARPSDR
jgi:hypothetical protein